MQSNSSEICYEDVQWWFRKTFLFTTVNAFILRATGSLNWLGVILLIMGMIFLFCDLVVAQAAIDRRDSENEND